MSDSLSITLDRSSPVPLYHQVAQQLELAIRQGVLAPGDKIDNEIALANTLGLSRPTMRQAIQTLVDKGMLVRKRGVGTQVVHGKIRRNVELTSLYDDLAAAGQQQRTEVLALRREHADETTAAQLRLAAGDDIWTLHRLRFVNDEPLALLRNHLPAALVDLTDVDLASSGLYEHLRRAGVHLRVAEQRIGAKAADDQERELLASGDVPLLTMERTAFNDAGSVIEYGHHVYRSDLYAFEITLVDR
ncbi:GntR family transcriptional regulator [Aeromicrobium phragmitis]|uniref:GntR family transcriptional regulator n=1 Tax=Aeromicrobium phragmitis TaxID=2478914 RepID=A0A3L8PIH4_9ACTN|nr:GntR family transcriptional regulator [Aeromicrobium phragmitis]RLV55176.1 GntR family transcriptional regulator [Aeromicrobium phragmitis]